MRVVVAPDSFKESLGAVEVAEAMRSGVLAAAPDADVVVRPLADGGEGTAAVLVAATGGRWVPATVTGPSGDPVESGFGLLGDGTTAVVELASAAGLELVPPDRRDPTSATTHGVGELVARALDAGARRIVLGLGGSATNDGGAGLLVALGARLEAADGSAVDPVPHDLGRVSRVDLGGLDPRLADVDLDVACDVDNPLLGERGATAVFGPQKGVTDETRPTLETALSVWADVVEAAVGRTLRDVQGAGAAGGAGFALLAVGARLVAGSRLVADAVGLPEAVRGADLVLTGEGRVDGQTLAGKAPAEVVRLAVEAEVPVVVLGGSVAADADALLDRGATAVLPVAPGPATLEELVADAAALVERSTRQAVRIFCAGSGVLGHAL